MKIYITLKNVFLLVCASIFLTEQVHAQAPEKMSYQTIVRNASNNLVVSTAVGIQISILQTTVEGTAVYVETHASTTNVNGLVSLEIGDGTVVTGTFASINWANGPYFVKTEIDPAGGTTYSISGTSQLLSVPYALHAKSAGTLDGGKIEALEARIGALEIRPDAPIIGVATFGNGHATVSYTAPAYGGIVPITSYTATSSPGNITGSVTQSGSGTITVNGLEYGTNYTFTVTATNSYGVSSPSASSNTVTTPTSALAGIEIGDAYQGGIVAYILQPGDAGYDANLKHGIIAYPSDVISGVPWFNGYPTTTNATGINIGSGQANTTTIVNNQGAGSYAARLCNDLTLAGYSDWYLPSGYELDKLYVNRAAIGGFASAYYWSSTELSMFEAYAQSFQTGGIGIGSEALKDNSYFVRAIRAF